MYARVVELRHPDRAPNAPSEVLKWVWLRSRTGGPGLVVHLFADEQGARAHASSDDEVWEVIDLAGRFHGHSALVHALDGDAVASVCVTALDRARSEVGNLGAVALVRRDEGRGLVLTFWGRSGAPQDLIADRYELVDCSDAEPVGP